MGRSFAWTTRSHWRPIPAGASLQRQPDLDSWRNKVCVWETAGSVGGAGAGGGVGGWGGVKFWSFVRKIKLLEFPLVWKRRRSWDCLQWPQCRLQSIELPASSRRFLASPTGSPAGRCSYHPTPGRKPVWTAHDKTSSTDFTTRDVICARVYGGVHDAADHILPAAERFSLFRGVLLLFDGSLPPEPTEAHCLYIITSVCPTEGCRNLRLLRIASQIASQENKTIKKEKKNKSIPKQQRNQKVPAWSSKGIPWVFLSWLQCWTSLLFLPVPQSKVSRNKSISCRPD